MLIPLSELTQRYGVRPRGIIHVGGHTGEELESYVQNQVPQVIWIEANPSVYQYLCTRLEKHPSHRAFQFAAHEVDGLTLDLNVMLNTQSSSILNPKEHLKFYPEIQVTGRIPVPTKTLDTLVTEERLSPEDFNFLNLDVQGAELLVLKGFQKNLSRCDYIYTEVNTDYLYENCCLLPELDEFLGAFGFRRVLTEMTPDRWGDALYTRLE